MNLFIAQIGCIASKMCVCLYNFQVLLVPSAFTKVTGEAHWEILLRARAVENQCYVRIYFYIE